MKTQILLVSLIGLIFISSSAFARPVNFRLSTYPSEAWYNWVSYSPGRIWTHPRDAENGWSEKVMYYLVTPQQTSALELNSGRSPLNLYGRCDLELPKKYSYGQFVGFRDFCLQKIMTANLINLNIMADPVVQVKPPTFLNCALGIVSGLVGKCREYSVTAYSQQKISQYKSVYEWPVRMNCEKRQNLLTCRVASSNPIMFIDPVSGEVLLDLQVRVAH